jgi:hypothetical protein
MMNKEPDRLVSATFFMPDGTQIHSDEGDVISFDADGYMINDEHIGWPYSVSPVIESGTEIVVRRGCAKRQGHRGSHGHYRWRRWMRRLATW